MVKGYLDKNNYVVKNGRLLISRASNEFLAKLLENNVPEIASGKVEVMGVAREAGIRAKVAVIGHDPRIDAKGACIGFRNQRIESMTRELSGEKIDIIEYDSWVMNTLSNWMIIHSELAETHIFEKIVYWKLESSHNVLIKRDRKFFGNIYPLLEDTWSKVLYYRDNLDKLDELKTIIEKRKKYKKFDTEININDNELIENKLNFLYDKIEKKPVKKFEKKNIVLSSEYENCDFVD
jgi:hypothetical protein